MNFELSDDQRMLKDLVERLVVQDYDFDARQRFSSEEAGYSPAMWGKLADLGLLGLGVPEEHGGSGKTPIETMIMMEVLGRAMVVEPVLSTSVIGAFALMRFASADDASRLLPALAAGELKVALATTERHSGHDLHDVETRATPVADGFRITGAKSVVLHGGTADLLLVSARLAGERRDPAGIGLFMLPVTSPGVSVRSYRLQDATAAAEIGLDDVIVPADALLVGGDGGHEALREIEAVAIAAICAEAVGVMGEMHAMTLDYLKTRKQFGVAIGSFQSLQHRAAEMFVMLEQARSMAMLAAVACTDSDPVARDRAISAAKVQIGQSGRFIGQAAVQLHGGIGMTMEYKVGHLYKRMAMIEILFGDTDHHLDRVADLGGFPDAA